jgi:pimeloyl-ACP methyl ester carboxylesterase
MDRLVKDVAELLDRVGCDSVHIAGNSAGGYIAQHLAMAQPQRVKSLALFAAGTGLKHTQATGWLSKVEKEGLRPFLARTISERFPANTDPKLVEWFLEEAAKNDVPFIARFIGLMTTLEWSDSLHLIRCHTLVVCPGAETIGSQNDYDRMKKSIANCTLISYRGMPHNISDAFPDRCAQDVLTFLRWHFSEP